jgi:hypothetical protein
MLSAAETDLEPWSMARAEAWWRENAPAIAADQASERKVSEPAADLVPSMAGSSN